MLFYTNRIQADKLNIYASKKKSMIALKLLRLTINETSTDSIESLLS